MNKITPQPMIEREAQNAGTVATDRQGETPELSGRNVPREIPGFPRPGLGCGPANRPPDAALDPADVAQLERIQALADDRQMAMSQRDSLLEQVKTLERHLKRVGAHSEAWRNEALAYRRRFRLLILMAGAVIVVLLAALAGALRGRM